MGLSLAWWHNYKWASFRILYVFWSDFIAPFYHRLYPDQTFDIKKMSFPSVTTLLSYIRLSYPLFRADLIEQMENKTLSVRSKTLLDNLYSLCEYFIPTVTFFLILWYVFFHFIAFMYIKNIEKISWTFSVIIMGFFCYDFFMNISGARFLRFHETE